MKNMKDNKEKIVGMLTDDYDGSFAEQASTTVK